MEIISSIIFESNFDKFQRKIISFAFLFLKKLNSTNYLYLFLAFTSQKFQIFFEENNFITMVKWLNSTF